MITIRIKKLNKEVLEFLKGNSNARKMIAFMQNVSEEGIKRQIEKNSFLLGNINIIEYLLSQPEFKMSRMEDLFDVIEKNL
jgi:hypothetical protein